MHINIISESDRRIPRKKIKELISLIEDDEDPPDSILNIIFVRDKHITALNKRFRGKKRPTDVLSFNIDSEPGENAVLGEIYISTDTASGNASDRGENFSAELIRLCCHGFLHLLGYDHISKKDREVMEAREEYYMERYRR